MAAVLEMIYAELVIRQRDYSVWIDRLRDLTESEGEAAESDFHGVSSCLVTLSHAAHGVLNDVLQPILEEREQRLLADIEAL